MPANLLALQRSIVGILVLCELGPQENILTHLIACTVQQQGREQPGHSAVAIQEGVDTQEVVNKIQG